MAQQVNHVNQCHMKCRAWIFRAGRWFKMISLAFRWILGLLLGGRIPGVVDGKREESL